VALKISPMVLVRAFLVETFQSIILRRGTLMKNSKDNSKKKQKEKDPLNKNKVLDRQANKAVLNKGRLL